MCNLAFQFRDEYSLKQILDSREVYAPLTMLQVRLLVALAPFSRGFLTTTTSSVLPDQ